MPILNTVTARDVTDGAELVLSETERERPPAATDLVVRIVLTGDSVELTAAELAELAEQLHDLHRKITSPRRDGVRIGGPQ